MADPAWFAALSWSEPIPIEKLRADRDRLPVESGVYIFKNYGTPLEKNYGILYVGKAKSLHKRVQSYLADPAKLLLFSDRSGNQRLNTSLRHAGKVQLLMGVQQKYRELGDLTTFMWVRWHVCPAPATLENQLIKYLSPAYNSTGK